MPPKYNPQKLNSLQLRTLAIFQRLAQLQPHIAKTDDDGSVTIWHLPNPHGDHFHLGSAIIRTKDATGLQNEAAWIALERKGFIKGDFPIAVRVNKPGLEYETGPLGIFIEHSDH